MELLINTKLKTIDISSDANIGELIDLLEKMFPNNEHRSYKLVSKQFLPVTIIKEVPIFPYISPYQHSPYNPISPWITYCGDIPNYPNVFMLSDNNGLGDKSYSNTPTFQ